MKAGFIGLGIMGRPIARNLLDAGIFLNVWNRSPAKSESLVEHGAMVAASPRDAAQFDVLLTMVTGDDALEELFFHEGLIDTMPASAIHISLSTISIAMARRLRDAHAQRGRAFVAAPVIGRAERAADRSMYVVAAGPQAAKAACAPIFDAICQRVFDFGEDPSAAVAIKIANNFMIGCTIEMLAEAFSITDGHQIPRAKFVDYLSQTLFTSPIVSIYGGLMTEGRYQPASTPLAIGLKDMGLAIAAASSVGTSVPMARVVERHLNEATGQGRGQDDWSSLGHPVNRWGTEA